ncbi:serine/threonine-protein kinase [Thermocrispum sp.]|uniref:Serine/threonine protein kinase n=1 Tax=Thermocrispum agreste TaxID=37925 RepID=A0A2W4JK35_9PSEU|nr:serine/threonine-protein kinase [Thermocrispum sp.]PZM99484.1 MAG: serine/threonine protein kinase [Thermocrispum agreste]
MFTDLAGSLLSFAKQLFGPGICPGEWVWATMTAGALIALLPVLASVIVALVRKVTGNVYNTATIATFATVGGVFVLVLPWMLMMGASEVYHAAFTGGGPGRTGLTFADLESLRTTECELVGNQRKHLGGGQNVFEVVFYPKSSLSYWLYLIALVGLPLLVGFFVMLQARMAMRRGPHWPARLLWGPFVALALLSMPVSANTAMYLWIGFLPISVLGLVPLAMIGPPSWQAIRRADQKAALAAAPPAPPPYRPEPAPPPPPPPPPPKQYAPTALAPQPEPGSPGGPVPAMAAAAAPLPRKHGRYRRVRKLGHGGMGTVWEAIDTQLDRRVALKIAHAPDPDTEQRMQREAKALAQINHPNCVKVYDLVEEEDGLALVMEYLEGEALAFAVDRNGPIDDVAAARLWSTMASALLAAHERGVLHRDVKPSNVIIDPAGTPHLIDFGIARSKDDAKMTATGMMIGTPDYTAPETANGAPATPASDAWQLAATVSYALTGHPPRGVKENPMAALIAASRAEPPSHLPERSVHIRLLRASLDAQPRNRPTLQTVVREVNGWLAKVGESREGPVTRMMPRA